MSCIYVIRHIRVKAYLRNFIGGHSDRRQRRVPHFCPVLAEVGKFVSAARKASGRRRRPRAESGELKAGELKAGELKAGE